MADRRIGKEKNHLVYCDVEKGHGKGEQLAGSPPADWLVR